MSSAASVSHPFCSNLTCWHTSYFYENYTCVSMTCCMLVECMCGMHHQILHAGRSWGTVCLCTPVWACANSHNNIQISPAYKGCHWCIISITAPVFTWIIHYLTCLFLCNFIGKWRSLPVIYLSNWLFLAQNNYYGSAKSVLFSVVVAYLFITRNVHRCFGGGRCTSEKKAFLS